MKYIAILFLSISLNSFAQSEKNIFLQTDPEERYIVSYTYGSYTFLFGYNDFLDEISINAEENQAIRMLIDPKIAAKGFVDLNDAGQNYIVEGEKISLKASANNYCLSRLINSGNFILLDASGKMNIDNLVKTSKTTSNNKNQVTYTNSSTGQIVYEYQRRFNITGCPSF